MDPWIHGSAAGAAARAAAGAAAGAAASAAAVCIYDVVIGGARSRPILPGRFAPTHQFLARMEMPLFTFSDLFSITFFGMNLGGFLV